MKTNRTYKNLDRPPNRTAVAPLSDLDFSDRISGLQWLTRLAVPGPRAGGAQAVTHF
jgi:hypothetical protein